MHDRTHDGRPVRMLTVLDEYTRESLANVVKRRLTSHDVLSTLGRLFVQSRVPQDIRSDNGSEFTAKAVREWLGRLGVETLFIEPGSPWENGYLESFNGQLRDELLSREVFMTLREAQVWWSGGGWSTIGCGRTARRGIGRRRRRRPWPGLRG